MGRPGNLKDLTGERFGRLVVEAHDHTRRRDAKHVERMWRCRCDCGKTSIVVGHLLTGGKTRSCGCFKIERVVAQGHKNRKHGASFTPEYFAWCSMKKRCASRDDPQWKDYGGRGIRVCARWASSFENFIADVGPRPPGKNGKRSEYTIERIDNDGDYEPGNCRWATKKEQAQNRRSNHPITIDGETRLLTEWCRLYGVRVPMVRQRILKGMSPKEALTKPSLRA